MKVAQGGTPGPKPLRLAPNGDGIQTASPRLGVLTRARAQYAPTMDALLFYVGRGFLFEGHFVRDLWYVLSQAN